MKIHFDIDATPQELRSFFGLPNLEPLQNEMLEMLRKNMAVGLESYDPSLLMKSFLPEHLQALTTLQKIFWQTMLGQLSHSEKSENKD